MLVDGRVDDVRCIVVRRPVGRWFYAVLATLLSLAVSAVTKLLDIFASLASFLTFAGGVLVGVLSFVLVYLASKSGRT